MPVFGDNELTPDQKREIITYVKMQLQDEKDPGGLFNLGRYGPVTEGLAIFIVGITILVFAALWRLGVAKANCGVVDLYWSFGFAVIAWLELAIGDRWDGYRLAFIALVTAWAMRLGWHLADRHRTARGEDARYRIMRERNGPGWPMKSFWMVFMLQAVILWIIAAPIHVVLAGPVMEVD